MPLVRAFHQILIWPLQLLPLTESSKIHRHWEFLEKDHDRVWKEVDDEFCADPDGFQERHYREFVTFLPYVQRLLYGEGAKRRSMASYGESPIKVYRRTDVAKVRVALPGRDAAVVFDVRHADLYFFYDVDLVILAVEISGAELAARCRAGDAASLRPRLSGRLGRAWRWPELPAQGGMAGGGRPRACGLGLRRPQAISGLGVPRTGAEPRRALAISAEPDGRPSHRTRPARCASATSNITACR